MGRLKSRSQGATTDAPHYGDLTDIPIADTNSQGEIVRSYVSAFPQTSSAEALVNQTLSSLVNLPGEGAIDQVLGASKPIKPSDSPMGTNDPPGLVKQRTGNATSYPIADGHGDVTATADVRGGITARYAYDPWGVSIGQQPAPQMGYLGQYLRRSDGATGLTQMGARQYDPGLGRFMSEDKVLGRTYMGQSWNRHSYVYNRPLVMYDLDGRSVCDVPIIGSVCDIYGNEDSPARDSTPSCSSIMITPTPSCIQEAARSIQEAARSIQWKDVENFGQGCLAGGTTSAGLVGRVDPVPAHWAIAGAIGCLAGGTTQAATGVNWIRNR